MGARPAACSNSRVYVDHALIEGWHQSSVMEQDTRLPICVFSTTRKGTMVRVHVVSMSMGDRYVSLHGSTGHQLDLVSYMDHDMDFCSCILTQGTMVCGCMFLKDINCCHLRGISHGPRHNLIFLC